MKKSYNSDSAKLDRKTVERNRRMHMKSLCFKLSSLISNHHHYHSSSKDITSQFDRLDHAALYIRQLKERIEELKRRKRVIMGGVQTTSIATTSTGDCTTDQCSTRTGVMSLPVLELRDLGSTLEVILISGLNKDFMFYQVIAVLEEEGAEVVNASFSIVGDKVIHTIHSQVTSSRVGIEISSVRERLKELVY